jgi:co-chaperonin GroES (HSP10)
MADGQENRPPDERPRPSPRARPAAPRPSPRARVAGSRRDREDAVDPAVRRATAELSGTAELPVAEPEKAAPEKAAPEKAAPTATARARTRRSSSSASAGAGPGTATGTLRRRIPAAVLVLSLLCVLAAAGGGVLLWQRLHPTHVDPSIFAAARSGIQAVYAYDYEDSEGSVQGKLDALTGDLRTQYEQDLTDGGIISSYEQVSATTRYEVLDVGLQQVDESQETATVVVFGQYVLKSVNSGTQPAPEGSECQVTPEGAQSCVQTVRATLVDVDGDWKISELTVLTTS